eukprot:4930295-Amphidinium_carterae.1
MKPTSLVLEDSSTNIKAHALQHYMLISMPLWLRDGERTWMQLAEPHKAQSGDPAPRMLS